MTAQAEESAVDAREVHSEQPCMCETYARATERAALAGARWLGRADQAGAEEAAVSGMRSSLEDFAISGRVVVGSADPEDALASGIEVGAGGVEVDLALDPLEGR